jgi:hypothetical protein
LEDLAGRLRLRTLAPATTQAFSYHYSVQR